MNFVKKADVGTVLPTLQRADYSSAKSPLQEKPSGLKDIPSLSKVSGVFIGRDKLKMSSTNFKLSFQIIILSCALIGIGGCKEPQMSSNEQIKAFELAGPIIPQLDIDQLLKVKDNRGIYTVGTGDLLELQIPTILTAVSPKLYKNQQQQIQPYLCRVSQAGTITLPIIGETKVEGKTLSEIEKEVVNAYYPKYAVSMPTVVCNIKEYCLKDVTVIGAVAQPGVYKLQSNEMSLVNALMKAGGIIEGGASMITIKNPNRKYLSSGQAVRPANDVRQLADLQENAGEKDFSALAVDLVFRPEGVNSSKGELVVQRGTKTLYSKRIDIQDASQRAEYTKGLQEVIGAEQACIVGQAVEQLGGQFASASATNQAEHPYNENYTAGNLKDNSTYIPKPIKAVSSDYRPSNENVGDIVLPVKGLNIPFADVPLTEGDLIEVKRINPAVFTVIGLAKNPGAFPYPPDVEYNLMQALGFAGGVDLIADPRFVTIYRQDGKGEVVSAGFRIDKEFMAKACGVKIKPGDVISVDVTPRTKRNVLLHQILRLNFGLYVNPKILD